MRRLVFLAAIFLSLAFVRTDNKCSGGRSGGLIATTLCRNPSTGEPLNGVGDNCEFNAAKTQACCINPDEQEQCPIAKAVGDDTDYEYDSRVTVLIGQSAERLCPVVKGVPWEHCTYNEDEFTAQIENVCTSLEELNEFALCQQGCEEMFPSTIPSLEGTKGDEPDDDDYDYEFSSIAFLGGRSDAIGAKEEKRCGTRDFKEAQLPKNEAIVGEFPWACSIFTQDVGETEGRYLGGCTIISNERDNDIQKPTYRVITAASKIVLAKNDPLKVRLRFTRGGSIETDHVVSQFLIHPDFHKQRLSDNIAVMALADPIDLVKEEGVNAACLPACNDMFDHTFRNHTGVRCWSAGFGEQEIGGQKEFVLRKQDIPIFPNRDKCEGLINDALDEVSIRKRRKRTKLSAGEICAGGEKGKDTCSGDGGSPLVCQAVSGRWHVVGLVSWGIGCGVEGRPAIYTNVYNYLDFIYSFNKCVDGNWRVGC